ncbi:papain-like cysteine protease family protein [Amycolatopsis japonica]|uniref:papain-like cysteine protease family protein n=1 Tax=Amycolatopsis japonica TaxID=208439 RepID=UPI00380E2722
MRKPFRSMVAVAVAVAGLSFGSPVTATAATAAYPDSYENDISMRVQEHSMWCWAASGSTLAAFHGVSVSQTKFCQYVHGGTGTTCADEGAWLREIQPAFEKLGFSSSGTTSKSVSYETIQRELSSGRPIPTDIHWRSGGGHIQLLYGYDKDGELIYWGDPGPDSERYNWGTYDYYLSNDSFTWAESLVGVKR